MFLDYVDGAVARRWGSSAYGRVLDSLYDSLGWVVFPGHGHQPAIELGLVGRGGPPACSAWPGCCALSRFTVEGYVGESQPHYVGLPVLFSQYALLAAFLLALRWPGMDTGPSWCRGWCPSGRVRKPPAIMSYLLLVYAAVFGWRVPHRWLKPDFLPASLEGAVIDTDRTQSSAADHGPSQGDLAAPPASGQSVVATSRRPSVRPSRARVDLGLTSLALVDRRMPGLGLVGFFACTDPAGPGWQVLDQAGDWATGTGSAWDAVYGPIKRARITRDYRFNLAADYRIPGEPVNPSPLPPGLRRGRLPGLQPLPVRPLSRVPRRWSTSCAG